MTKDGFTLLAMGFTGAKALEFNSRLRLALGHTACACRWPL